MFSLKDPSSRLTPIRLDLEEHDFVIEHIKGKDNVVADALSRIHIDELKSIRCFVKQILAMQTRSMTRKQEKIQEKRKEQRETNPRCTRFYEA